MEYRRTAVIKPDTPESLAAPLRETVEQFKPCAKLQASDLARRRLMRICKRTVESLEIGYN
ncbi:hypothetical protein D3D01_20895 [Haloarcula sp. Atlit-7R]|nr:hypothetical protein D3D01_20895 [Haloarcula sp. Atlit-7R]